MGVIVKLHNDECLIYILTGEVLNGTPNILNKSQYYCWFTNLRNQVLPLLQNNTR